MKFCFFGNIADTLRGRTFGGGELQISLLAKSLASNGHEVVIIDPFSHDSFTTPEGIEVKNIPNWNKGIRGLRFFLFRAPGLMRMFTNENADFYYARMRYYLYLFPYWVAKKIGAKFIVAAACDLDVMGFMSKYRYEYKGTMGVLKMITLAIPNDLVYSFLLKKADYVVLQHEGQKKELKPLKGRILIFQNLIDLEGLPVVDNATKDFYIYLGSITTLKGAANLKELVASLVNTQIIIVGEPRDEMAGLIYGELKQYPHVTLTGRLSHKDSLKLLANAKALVNTSFYEGFSNTFIEAWALGVPVISLNVDPDNIITRNNLGICCNGDLAMMKHILEKGSVEQINTAGLISYVKANHDFEGASTRFIAGLSAKLGQS